VAKRQLRETNTETRRTFVIGKRMFELDASEVRRVLARVTPEPIREHYVVVDGRRFPPKQVIELATGLDRADFTTHHARRILQRLGFPAARRASARRGSGKRQLRVAGSSTDHLRPHIGQWVATRHGEVLVAASSPTDVVAWLTRHRQQADSMFRVPGDESEVDGAAPA
jgi:hypothetical protein